MRRCVIVGGADIGDYPLIRQKLREDDFFVFCDSGLSHMDALGAKPNLIVGDFDSHENPRLETETIVLPREKDDTDTVYAVKEALRRGFGEFLLIGVVHGNSCAKPFQRKACLGLAVVAGENIIITILFYATGDGLLAINLQNSFVSGFHSRLNRQHGFTIFCGITSIYIAIRQSKGFLISICNQGSNVVSTMFVKKCIRIIRH